MQILARHVSPLPTLAIARSIALPRDAQRITDGLVRVGDIRSPSHQDIWRLEECRSQATLHMPLGMAVEQPDTRVISLEPDGSRTLAVDDERISAHGVRPRGIETGEEVSAGCAGSDLEGVPVQMEGMGPVVVVVDVDFHHGVEGEDVWVGAAAVDGRVHDDVCRGAEGCEHGRHLLGYVGLPVEHGPGGTVAVLTEGDG